MNFRRAGAVPIAWLSGFPWGHAPTNCFLVPETTEALKLGPTHAAVVEEDSVSNAKATLQQRVLQGMRLAIVIVSYLFVVFSLFDIYKSVILAEHQIDFLQFGLNFINAWALAKVILVCQELNLADQLRDAPLI
jgi:hypothetical protein